MPFLEVARVDPDIVHYVGEPTGVERPDLQVADDLGFVLDFALMI